MAETILVVGASRGLGLGLVGAYLAQGLDVIATSRGDAGALHDLAATHDRLRLETLDVTDTAAIAALKTKLGGTTLDVLFHSAGTMSDQSAKAANIAAEEFARVMVTNALAPLKVIEALGDRVSRDGAIVAMTSVLGSVGGNTSGGYEVYRASKAALDSLLRSYAARHTDRAVIAMHPGWVRTDMGGPQAALSVEESVKGMLAAIDARRGKPGCVFIDYRGQTIPW